MQEERVDGRRVGRGAPDERMNGCLGRAGRWTSGGQPTDGRTGGACMDFGWVEGHRTSVHYITYVGLSMCNKFYFYNKVTMHSLVLDPCRLFAVSDNSADGDGVLVS